MPRYPCQKQHKGVMGGKSHLCVIYTKVQILQEQITVPIVFKYHLGHIRPRLNQSTEQTRFHLTPAIPPFMLRTQCVYNHLAACTFKDIHSTPPLSPSPTTVCYNTIELINDI